MVATTYMWVVDQEVVVTLSIYTVGASNEDQALLMDIRKKDMINNLKVIMTFVIIELQKSRHEKRCFLPRPKFRPR